MITLAIESAIAGGSLCLLQDDLPLAENDGNVSVSRSEELLPAIVDLLERAAVPISTVSRVAVSNGPGSYTGIRIGIATALGLKESLSIECVGLSVLEAMAVRYGFQGSRLPVVQLKENEFAWQVFLRQLPQNDPRSGTLDELFESINDVKELIILAPTPVAGNLIAAAERGGISVVPVEANLARHIGIAARRISSKPPAPVYLRRQGIGPGLS